MIRANLYFQKSYGLQILIIDIETAFLHGPLREEIYKNASNGMDKCLRQKKDIYGLVQSAREIYKTLICELKDLEVLENLSDPWLSKGNNNSIMISGI
jgi:Reverse transcriptase (RNA-dependent DNA polymerase)